MSTIQHGKVDESVVALLSLHFVKRAQESVPPALLLLLCKEEENNGREKREEETKSKKGTEDGRAGTSKGILLVEVSAVAQSRQKRIYFAT